MSWVLVVEDDAGIRAALVEGLSAHGHVVRSAPDGFSALREVAQGNVDVVVLDLGLPDLDGGDVLRMIRGISQVPVVVATARDDDAEVIALLNAGADDYLVKPFSGGQLAARLAAILRRAAGVGGGFAAGGGQSVRPADSQGAVSVGDLRVDPLGRTAHLSGAELNLTRREFDLLAYLAHHADLVVSKRTILAEVWRETYVDDQTIDVHLSSLRRKLGNGVPPPLPAHGPRSGDQAGDAAVRRTLAWLAAAVTSMVALAFLIPLALLVRSEVRTQATTAAEQRAAALAPVLTLTTNAADLRAAIASLDPGGNLAVRLPSGDLVGTAKAPSSLVLNAVEGSESIAQTVPDGWVYLQPVVLARGQVAVVEAFVPQADLSRGVESSWAVMSVLAVGLVLGSVLVADRLGARVVRSSRGLSKASAALGAGDLDSRVDPIGPPELREAGLAFNAMADRVRAAGDRTRAGRGSLAPVADAADRAQAGLRTDHRAGPGSTLGDRGGPAAGGRARLDHHRGPDPAGGRTDGTGLPLAGRRRAVPLRRVRRLRSRRRGARSEPASGRCSPDISPAPARSSSRPNRRRSP